MAREVRIEDHTVKEGEPSEKYIGPKKAQSVGEVTVNVDVDVSEALTGLKALQREAHEATEALRELEEAQKRSQTAPWMPGYGWTTNSNWSKSGGASIKSVRQDGDDE